jgi:hypothetical protein
VAHARDFSIFREITLLQENLQGGRIVPRHAEPQRLQQNEQLQPLWRLSMQYPSTVPSAFPISVSRPRPRRQLHLSPLCIPPRVCHPQLHLICRYCRPDVFIF